MDLEKTKKIIQNKITADEAAREVRSQIKTYIHEKQNLREGFKETFKPLIETSEKVKGSIDTQQNKLIKQLQKNQLALTEGLDKNRLAVTSGFDKMDEVKRWDLQQLPGYEAIEEPEMEKEEEPEMEKEEEYETEDIYGKIKRLHELIQETKEDIDSSFELAKEAEEEGKMDFKKYYLRSNDRKKIYQKLIKEREILLKKIKEEDIEGEPSKRVITFDDDDLDEGLNNATADKILKVIDLPRPKLIKKESLKTIKAYPKKSEDLLKVYRDLLINKAEFNIIGGVSKAFARNKNPHTDTLSQISYYNVLGDYVNNMNKLVDIVKKNRPRYHPLQ